MIPLLNATQFREADRRTIAEEGITSIQLMERAAQACTAWLLTHPPTDRPFVIVAGMGNNGGDGVGIARLLHLQGRVVRLLLAGHRSAGGPDREEQVERARGAGVPMVQLKEGDDLPEFVEDEVVIDALFGTGLDRPLAGWPADLVRAINARRNTAIAIDMPSGLQVNRGPGAGDPIVEADHTLTFELPKLTLLLPGHERYAGAWHALPIGLSPGYLQDSGTPYGLVEARDVAGFLPARTRSAHKGNFGHAWLLAGSRSKMGAAVLAAHACLRSGPGLITAHVPSGTEAVIQASIPEVMTSADRGTEILEELPDLSGGTAIGIGPGVGTDDATARLLKLLIQQAPAPLVVDADAINILAANRTWLAFLPKGSILTPHPKEFDRLTEKHAGAYERLMNARSFAMRFGVVLVLKGGPTAVCSPTGQVFLNSTGNPGMAKGGSGDALTGILTGLRAQGVPAVAAALLGVYAHGLAGDIAAAERGMDGMRVLDLIERLPQAWQQLRALG